MLIWERNIDRLPPICTPRYIGKYKILIVVRKEKLSDYRLIADFSLATMEATKQNAVVKVAREK